MSEETQKQQNNASKSFITDRKQLSDPKIFDEFKDIVDKIIDSDNREEAVKARLLLEDILIGKYPQLKAEAPELFDKYQKLIFLLKFEVLSARPFSEIEDLVGNHLVGAIRAKIPIHKKFQDVLDVYNDISEEGGIAESLANAMLKSNTQLGLGRITRPDGQTVAASIGNWLLDYDANSRSMGPVLKERGAVERITYVNKSQNARNLSNDDRKLLLIIMELYDWLKYGTLFQESTTIGTVINPVNLPQPAPPRPPQSVPTQAAITPLVHGRDLEVLREQLEKGRPVAPVQPRVFQAPAVKMTPAEIKREVAEIELPQHQEPKEISAPKPIQAPSSFKSASSLQSLAQISMVDDLKKIEIAHLRQGPLAQQLQTVRSKIFSIAQANRLYPYYTVNAFEQSPLFRAYLQTGSSKITENKTESGLTQAEFEAIADFKKEIERL